MLDPDVVGAGWVRSGLGVGHGGSSDWFRGWGCGIEGEVAHVAYRPLGRMGVGQA